MTRTIEVVEAELAEVTSKEYELKAELKRLKNNKDYAYLIGNWYKYDNTGYHTLVKVNEVTDNFDGEPLFKCTAWHYDSQLIGSFNLSYNPNYVIDNTIFSKCYTKSSYQEVSKLVKDVADMALRQICEPPSDYEEMLEREG